MPLPLNCFSSRNGLQWAVGGRGVFLRDRVAEFFAAGTQRQTAKLRSGKCRLLSRVFSFLSRMRKEQLKERDPRVWVQAGVRGSRRDERPWV